MIDNIKAVIISRMNNVLVFSFLISFTMVNSREILIFIYSDKIEKINILKNWQFNSTYDILLSLLMAFIYVTIIPLSTALFTKHIANRIYKIEHEVEQKRKLISYEGMGEVEMARAKGTAEYADLCLKNEILEWQKQKEETIQKLDSCEHQIKHITEECDSLKAAAHKSQESALYYQSLYERTQISMRGLCESIYDLNESSSSRLFERDTESLEFKKHIIAELSTKIMRMFESINAKPSFGRPFDTDREWQPPIDNTILSALSKYIHEATKK